MSKPADPRKIFECVVIDGEVYPVPVAVAAHIKFLSDLNSRFANRLAKLTGPREVVFGKRGQ